MKVAGARVETVLRPRLLDALDQAAALTVVRGPIGFGKTTLLRQWTTRRPDTERLVWLTVPGNASGSVEEFWQSLGVELVRAGLSVGDGARSDPCRAAEDALLGFPGEVLLVLDSYERATSSSVEAALAQLVGRRSGLRVVMASRTRSSFDRLERRDAGCTLIGPRQLAMTHSEAEGIFESVGLVDSVARAGTVCEELGGWPAALRAIAVALREATGQVSADRVVRRAALDYLRGCVLPSLADPSQARFLYRSAVAEELTAWSVRAFADVPDPAACLVRLEDQGLLLSEVVDGELRYRWPRLARQVLLEEFIRQHPDEVETLHRQLAAWYRENGNTAASLRHAIAVQDWPNACETLLSDWFSLVERHSHLVAHLFAQLPGGRVTGRPLLALIRDMVSPLPPPEGDPSRHAVVAHANSMFAKVNTLGEAIDTGLALMMGLTRRGEVKRAAVIARRLMERVNDSHVGVWDVADRIPRVALQAGIVHQRNGDLMTAAPDLELAYRAAHTADQHDVAAAAAGLLALQAAFMGTTTRAQSWLAGGPDADEAAAPAIEEHASGRLARLILALDALDLPEVERIRHSIVSNLGLHHDLWAYTMHALAQHSLIGGDRLGTLALIQRLRQERAVDLGPGSFSEMLVNVAEAQVLMALGRTGEAHQILRRGEHLHPLHVGARARLAFLIGDFETAGTLATSVLRHPATSRRTRIDLLLIDAAAMHHQRNYRRAVNSLSDALAASRFPVDMWRPFALADRGTLQDLADAVTGTHDVLQVLSDRKLEEVFPAPVVLTDREKLVLTQLAAGLRQRDVAKELYVSPNTVKTQLRSIYRKLGVTSRTQALEVAVHRGLVPGQRHAWSERSLS